VDTGYLLGITTFFIQNQASGIQDQSDW